MCEGAEGLCSLQDIYHGHVSLALVGNADHNEQQTQHNYNVYRLQHNNLEAGDGSTIRNAAADINAVLLHVLL